MRVSIAKDMSHRNCLLASQLENHGDVLAVEEVVSEVPIDPFVPPPLLRIADFVEGARPVADLFGSGRQEFLCPLLLRCVFNSNPTVSNMKEELKNIQYSYTSCESDNC